MSHYRDTLIGPGKREITRGHTNGYVWSITADTVVPGRMRVEIKNAAGTSVPVDKAPNYLAAEILSAIAS